MHYNILTKNNLHHSSLCCCAATPQTGEAKDGNEGLVDWETVACVTGHCVPYIFISPELICVIFVDMCTSGLWTLCRLQFCFQSPEALCFYFLLIFYFLKRLFSSLLFVFPFHLKWGSSYMGMKANFSLPHFN